MTGSHPLDLSAEVLPDPEVRRLTGSVGTTAEAERPQPLDGRERVTLEVHELNPRARRVHEKVGCVAVRTVENALVFDGVTVAATEMELTAERWSTMGR